MRAIAAIRRAFAAAARGSSLRVAHGARAELLQREASRQRLRLNRFLLAATFSILYLVVLAIYATQDKVDRETLVLAASIVALAIGFFFALFRSGLNLRFGDPSLTALQVLSAVFTMLLVVYRAPETRAVFAAFFFVALMFGMLRSSARQLAILGAASLAAFGAVAWMRYAGEGDVELLRLDMLQLGVTALTFPWLVFIGSRVKQLKEADRRKDTFLATLAHELRNPLAPIRTGVQVLSMTVVEPHGHAILPMIERQLQHLTRLLDDMLDVSRITRDKVALHVECIDVRDALQSGVEASRDHIEQMEHDFTMSVPGDAVWVDADPVRVAQIVSNLLNNAAKYTPSGGRIALTLVRTGDFADITVKDDGVGIPAERLATIFDMFTQFDAGPAPHSAAGLGIGLALVKGLVALHGGTIEARSDGVGRGSEFRVRLPARQVAPQLPAPPVPPRRGYGRLRVLVVDDNRDAASTLAMLVEMIGHEVRTANDGQTAVHLAAELEFDVVLMDLGMPGIDGYDACRRMRASAAQRPMRLVAVTGWGQEEDRRKSSAAGFDAHLVKPVRPESLIGLLGDLRIPA